tara:strand:+ start:98 stop:535 length:438 start_codon:yes stop_codon:yes gene_type:complete
MDGKEQFDNIMKGLTPDGSPRNSNSTSTTRSSSPFEMMEGSLKNMNMSDASKVRGSSSEDDNSLSHAETEDIKNSLNQHKKKLDEDSASFKESIGKMKETRKNKGKKSGGYRKRTRKNNKRKKTQKKRKNKKTKRKNKKTKRKTR